jgi:hypothetical protein
MIFFEFSLSLIVLESSFGKKRTNIRTTKAHLLDLAKSTIDAIQTRLFLKHYNHEGYRNSQKQTIIPFTDCPHIATYLQSPLRPKQYPLHHYDNARRHIDSLNATPTKGTCAPNDNEAGLNIDAVNELMFDTGQDETMQGDTLAAPNQQNTSTLSPPTLTKRERDKERKRVSRAKQNKQNESLPPEELQIVAEQNRQKRRSAASLQSPNTKKHKTQLANARVQKYRAKIRGK